MVTVHGNEGSDGLQGASWFLLTMSLIQSASNEAGESGFA